MTGNGRVGTGLALALVLVATAAAAVLAWRSDADAAPRASAAQATPTPTTIYTIPTPTPTPTASATPTPTPTPTPKSSLLLLIVAVRQPALRGRTLSWKVRCAPRACRATFRERILIRHHRAMRLPLVHHRVPTHAVRIERRLSEAQVAVVRRAWRHHRRVSSDLRGNGTDRLGHKASFRLKSRLRPPQRDSKRPSTVSLR
jgi:hypothetical protein